MSFLGENRWMFLFTCTVIAGANGAYGNGFGDMESVKMAANQSFMEGIPSSSHNQMIPSMLDQVTRETNKLPLRVNLNHNSSNRQKDYLRAAREMVVRPQTRSKEHSIIKSIFRVATGWIMLMMPLKRPHISDTDQIVTLGIRG